ncbi:outer membrane beta-barrel protein [Acidiphilium multivorum]|uniref:outer membrane beta-barrel protein n=1 Tax=Acidiphilium multivorum TaxID=62140 RepID=UPI001F4BD99D|nr:outer membrane beta-barrel protein [Acidiphilium multivorum]
MRIFDARRRSAQCQSRQRPKIFQQQQGSAMRTKRLIERKLLAGASVLALMAFASPAFAMNLPSAQKFEAGPLGTLDVSGGFSGYFYALSGASNTNPLGIRKSAGAEARVLDLTVKKSSGPFQFTIEVKPYASLYFGYAPSAMSAKTFTLGPLYAAYGTWAPTSNFSISVGQVYSTEGWESSTDWQNANLIDSPLYYVENSSSRGVQVNYTYGKLSTTLTFGDGFDSGVFNTFQELVTYSFNSNNALSLYGTQNVGATGPNTFAYGQSTTGAGSIPYVNSNMFGGYYDYTNGNLNVVPEVQYVYAKRNQRLGINKFTSNFGAEVITNYQFGKSPWSLGGMAFYYKNIGSYGWYLNANSSGFGIGVTPSWIKGHFFVRGEVGLLHLTNLGTGGTGGFGANGTDRNQVMSVLSAGIVF